MPADDTPPNSLAEAATQFGLTIPSDQLQLLDAYRQELWDWNEKINLTRHTTFEKFVGRDLADTLRLAEQIPSGERVLDIGSGGGVPGLPLAILRPDLSITCCDSVGKKAKVLEDIVNQLALPVTVNACRAEQVLEVATFDTLIARGVASMKKILTWLAPHWDSFDRLLLVKGQSWVNERGEARHHSLLKHLALRCLDKYGSEEFGESVVLSITPRGPKE